MRQQAQFRFSEFILPEGHIGCISVGWTYSIKYTTSKLTQISEFNSSSLSSVGRGRTLKGNYLNLMSAFTEKRENRFLLLKSECQLSIVLFSQTEE